MNAITITELTDIDHYHNLLKILDWDGYSKWDKRSREKLFYLHIYRRVIINQNLADCPQDSDFRKLLEVLNWDYVRDLEVAR